jgi:hypothetical protein
VRPATPVDETRPPVVARPYCCVARSTSPQVQPAPTRADPALRVDLDPLHRPDVDHDPPSLSDMPATECPPARTAISRPR